jgi:hypothetical protein
MERAYRRQSVSDCRTAILSDDAEAMLAKIHEAYDDVDSVLPSMPCAQMWQDHNLARFDAAEAGARTLLRLAEVTGNYGFRLNARMVLAAIATYRGDLPSATQLFVPDETTTKPVTNVVSLACA